MLPVRAAAAALVGALGFLVAAVGGDVCAFVTIVLSEDFVECTAVLVHSIRAVQSVQEVAVLVLPDITEEARGRLRAAGAQYVVEVEEVDNPNRVVLYRSFSKNYGILRVWQLETLTGHRFDRAVYMDSDMVMTRNSDDLCTWPELSAARDLGAPGARDGHSSDFNAGLMVFTPSEATFARLLDLAQHIGSPSGGVQPLLRAAFPDWTRLDHLRDNVNSHMYQHQHSEWQLSRIRSIHFTGPVKPCFTDADESAGKPLDEPFRVWHCLRGQIDSNAPSSCLVDAGMPEESHVGVTPLGMQEDEAWGAWFKAPDGDILHSAFGIGEAEYTGVPAYHACKHGSATFAGFAQRVFAAGFTQLQECFRGQCSDASHVVNEIVRAVRWMQRTLRLFLQRSSIDAQVDVNGLGSVESVLALHADKATGAVQDGLRKMAAEHSKNPHAFLFDMAVSVARSIRRQEQLARWHLTYTMLGLLWWQYHQFRVNGQDIQLPSSFQLELPNLVFQEGCCRTWDVLADLALGIASGQTAALLVEGPLTSGEMVNSLFSAVPLLAIFATVSTAEALREMPLARGAPTVPAYRLTLAESMLHVAESPENVLVADLTLVVSRCPERDAAPMPPEDEYARTFASLEYWSQVLRESSGIVAGCGFAAQHPGIVEAVSQYALQRDTHVSLSADSTWWIRSSPNVF